jgi:protein-tyrosine phosphatase
MPEVVDWRCCQPRDVVQRAVELLREGGLVVFPTDTGYALAASCRVPEAVSQVDQQANEGLLTIAVTGLAQLIDWVPQLSRLGCRLARNCWPGPLTIVVDADNAVELPLSEEIRGRVCCEGVVAFRAPAHDALQQAVLSLPSSDPVIFGEVAITPGAKDWQKWCDHAGMVIDDGPPWFDGPATVVRLEGNRWQMSRAGVLSDEQVEDLARCRIVFVCTGNTCRSPLAQALCAKLLADQLGCGVRELPQRGFIVQSAGLAAMMGAEAACEAVDIAGELGADLSGHRSQPLSHELLRQADFLFVMTRTHLQMLNSLEVFGGPAPRLLSPRGDDIPDPIGGSAEVYRECARAIVQHLEELLPELQASNS